ncbi:hypothetical protein [Sulfurovum sp.]|uniref:hypothetical protein n=1 Tax=Sulfurovum sp. TaxID=1969726 RepID=UPI002867ED07|nr:hypothetical protein [Sulfurovum sp.]
MRKFLLIFLRLLIPVTILVSVLLTLFFTVDYSFSQALSLGVLYGLFSGIGLTIILSIALLLLREGRENVEKTSKKTQKQQEIKANEELIKIESSLNQKTNKNQKNSMDHKLMLLMNKELTFEIILIALKNQFSRSLTTQNIDTGSIDVTTHDGIISISVLPLTKHTSQVTINGLSNSKYIQNIVSFLKEKEHSFLQY